MKDKEYQGWTNAQTWCVALWFNNSKAMQDKALEYVRLNLDDPSRAKRKLLRFALLNVQDVWNMAPWAWSDLQDLSSDVNWTEIYKHFETKVKEASFLDIQKRDTL